MASRLEVTPELLASIKEFAAKGLTQEQISSKLGRSNNTLFLNSKDKHPEILSVYNEGKAEDLDRLLGNMKTLESAKSEEVQFKTNKYQLAIKHKVVEQQKVDATVTGEFSLFTAKLKDKEQILKDRKK